jgi:hypothetical protein
VDELPLRFASHKLTSIEMIWEDLAGRPPRMVEPSFKEGMVSIPGSLMIRCAAGWRKYIPDSSRLRRLRKGLEQVRRRGGVFHVWFHPENLYPEWPRLENVVARFFEELGALVRNGDLRCFTMGQLASEFQSKLAVQQRCNRSPEYAHSGYVDCQTPLREADVPSAIVASSPTETLHANWLDASSRTSPPLTEGKAD